MNSFRPQAYDDLLDELAEVEVEAVDDITVENAMQVHIGSQKVGSCELLFWR